MTNKSIELQLKDEEGELETIVPYELVETLLLEKRTGGFDELGRFSEIKKRIKSRGILEKDDIIIRVRKEKGKYFADIYVRD